MPTLVEGKSSEKLHWRKNWRKTTADSLRDLSGSGEEKNGGAKTKTSSNHQNIAETTGASVVSTGDTEGIVYILKRVCKPL